MKRCPDVMLRVRDLRVEKAGSTICRVPKLEVSAGEHVAVIGPNGSGKSTLLRVLSGLEVTTHGECSIESPMRKRVYLHQTPYLFRGTALANVRYGLAARNVARRDQISTAHRWLEVFGVRHLAARRCSQLSGGERRRVALARTFAIRAELMLLDEPLAELDPEGIEIVSRAICGESEATILIASPVSLPAPLAARSYHLPVTENTGHSK
jgi:tungstate transport system ATP-binding protein